MIVVLVQLVVFRELLRTLFEDNFVGGVTPCCTGRTGGLVRVKVDDVLCDGDIGTGMTAGGTVAFLNKFTDLVIFEVQQTPAFINDVQFLEVTRRAVNTLRCIRLGTGTDWYVTCGGGVTPFPG